VALNQGFAYREQVGPDGAGLTPAAYLARRYAHSSAEVWAARVAAGEVRVGNAPALAETRLSPGDWLTWHRPPWDEPEVPLHFGVVYEDEHLLAVSKPSGLPTAPAGGFFAHTLVALVRQRRDDWSPVHRLGRGTSGLVLFARGASALSAVTRALREHEIEKHYLALAEGEPSSDRFTIEARIGPVEHPALGNVHAASERGREARSDVEVLERRGSASLCAVRIHTGRPHQIRIHLAHAGHPLVGDPLYARGGVPRAGVRALPGDGGYLLHAHRLVLRHPHSGGSLELQAPPPSALAPK
jgi:23S rRNA pseudouridine1911/1915/1917 synthase